jgi:serine phosphatase RsbU (regulator of sigma subunit)/sugar lactone lactonase YvrE
MGLIEAVIQSSGNLEYTWNENVIETRVSNLVRLDDKIIIATEDQGLYSYSLNDGHIEVIQCSGVDLSRYNINHLFIKDRGAWQLSTNNAGLVGLHFEANSNQCSLQTYGQETDIAFRSLKTSYTDREGNIWLGTFGEGLAMIKDKAICFHQAIGEGRTNNCQAICTRNGIIFRADQNQVFICDQLPQRIIDHVLIGNEEAGYTITALYADDQSNLWIGTQSNGLWKYNLTSRQKQKFNLSEDILNNQINDLTGFDNHIYVATEYGIFHIHDQVLLKNVISMQSGLAHNSVRSIFRDSQGRIWLASAHNQVTYIADGVIQNIDTPFNGALIEITCFAEDQNKFIWAGTDGNGIFQLTGSPQKTYGTIDGLRSDHCYGMAIDQHNRIWVTHRGAISRIDLNKKTVQIIEPTETEDVLFAYNAIATANNGIVYFGSDQGIVEYDMRKDEIAEVEPIIHLKKLWINDSLYTSSLIELKHGDYQLKLEVIAISLKNPEGVIYQYFLEGYDTDWSTPTTDRQIVYNKLSDGHYVLRVRAFNANGFGGGNELAIQLHIALPFWKTWWFLIACIIGLIGFVLLIIYSRERTLRQNQLNLQKALDLRTKEVVKQKELLELSNKDITDSIKYAKNIQQAMLPSHDMLNQHFTDSFIYFKPRDIVSGDFYTIEKFNDIVVVSCADCTGHGVPGAFMSLIGSTILKEVTTDKNVQNASEVLVKLDARLRDMLTKQGATSVSDGMDISIFDFNTKTRKLRLASANRSTFLWHNQTWIEIKGDRRNVGGAEAHSSKAYTLHEYEMHPGDAIYMFSDGITDQFGGVSGKKIKKSGLLDWIQSIHQRPMMEQREFIKKQFKSWKENMEQTDDVIVMGIRF